MEELLISIIACGAAFAANWISTILLSKKENIRESVIEFHKKNGKKQKIRVSSLSPENIQHTIETEIFLENIVRAALNDLIRSNGKIKIKEDGTADFIAQLGEETVLIEAKASINNLTKDFFAKADKELKSYHPILVVNSLTKEIPDSFKERGVKIINITGDNGKAKESLIREISNTLKPA
ncbi:hypothetical protein PA15_0313370 [Pseudomonas aeruginosa HB15]|uniref:hypothetical protein n=1 Tax=Pseudomonas aeruginosa TaxID=287 RepID=UPI0002120752|nr:hypothetical protein [Pseudomonas aeruginosa]EKU4114692.1 hypothetical protein [Pseudomonas aeruginosa]ELL4386240.1 hypothetical protein [Pseudomonas aeruginosa]ESQ66139.1 hypothetical protein PA15_0313370 [Pseudomonas aeruginosa HB15]KKJ54045.1 hypothetical protein T648_08060 [Pseudomonas aeruginosa MRSN 317]KSG52857.1 hypothetical protein AO953_18300 [Pseudomonas aeruginosa]